MSWAESKWVVDSLLQKIGQPPNNMRAFTAFSFSATSLGLKFLEPEDSYADGNLICSVGGVMIRMSTEGYPTNPNEGTLVIDNTNLGAYENEPFVVENLTEGTTYYFSAFPYSVQGVYNLSSNISNRATASPVSSIYGISRDTTSFSPAWTRTDNAVGKTATASIGMQAGSSGFDTCEPWSGIVRETLASGDVMVKIPKFYFQRYKEGNVEHIRIADKATEGFTVHPLFKHAGVEKDYAYIGAYKTSANNKSVSGASPQVSQTRATFRTNAKSKGTGWSSMDIAALSAIQMLMLVEFATNNVQTAIGRGYCDSNSAALNVGSCNSVPNLTGRPSGTDGKTDVVWRGIEGLWGNVWEWVDGVNWNGGTYYVCNDPSKYADDTATNYTQLSFTGSTSWSASYITQEGLDTGNNAHVMLPSAAGSGSESTYQCDACYSNTDWRVCQRGGAWLSGSGWGLFAVSLSNDSSASYAGDGSRLLYLPS